MAADYFLQIPGIDGESKDKDHEKWIELASVSFGFQNPTTIGSATGGAGSGKAVPSELVITKFFDSASPKIMQMLFTGTHKNDVHLNVRKAGGDKLGADFLKFTFSTVFCSQFDTSGSVGEDVPFDQVTFVYGTFSADFAVQKPDGTLGTPIHGGWDFILNKDNP